jgi:hypothetical protein
MKKITVGIMTTLGLVLTQSIAYADQGLGGYAIVHPDGHVCGVIVSKTSDPFGNGGTTATELYGCPSGSKIVFQTNPSPSGNVSGYSGKNVAESENKFTVSNDVGTVTTTIQNGIATDSSGTSWNTGAWSDKNIQFVDTLTATNSSINTNNDTLTATNSSINTNNDTETATNNSINTNNNTETATLQLQPLSSSQPITTESKILTLIKSYLAKNSYNSVLGKLNRITKEINRFFL